MVNKPLTCMVAGCGRPVEARHRCRKHYEQLCAHVGTLTQPRSDRPAHRWDTGIRECLVCQIRLPADELRRTHPCGPNKIVRSGVVDHYRLMIPPPVPHPGADPRFAPPGQPPRTELGRYCQQLLDQGALIPIRHEGAA